MIYFKARRYFLRGIFLYLLIILQITFGFGVMVIAQNAYLTGDEQLRDWKSRFTNQEYMIKYTNTQKMPYMDYVEPEVVTSVANKYKEQADVLYATLYYADAYIEDTFVGIHFLALSPQAMDCFVGNQSENIIIDSDFYAKIKPMIQKIPHMEEKEGTFVIRDNAWSLEIRTLPDAIVDFSTSGYPSDAVPNRFALDEVIIIPLKAIDELEKFPTNFGKDMISVVQLYDLIRVNPKHGEEKIVIEIRDEINKKTADGVQYIVQNVIGEITHTIQFAESEVKQRDTYAKIGMISTVIGTIGVMWIQLQKRKKDIAICVMLGSTLRQQWKEIVLESGIVIGTGVILANLLAIRFNALGDSPAFPSRLHGLSSLYSIAGGFIILAIVSVILFVPMKKMDPIQILTEEAI